MKAFFLPLILILFVSGCSRETQVLLQGRKFPKNGYITMDRMSMRVSPFILSSKVSILNKGIRVKLMERTAEKERIGSVSNYWYRIQLNNGINGWVFGSGISFKPIADSGTKGAPGTLEFSLATLNMQSVLGYWVEMNQSGGNGNRLFNFKEDMAYHYSDPSSRIKHDGKYEVDSESGKILLEKSSPAGSNLDFFFVGKELRFTLNQGNQEIIFRHSLQHSIPATAKVLEVEDEPDLKIENVESEEDQDQKGEQSEDAGNGESSDSSR